MVDDPARAGPTAVSGRRARMRAHEGAALGFAARLGLLKAEQCDQRQGGADLPESVPDCSACSNSRRVGSFRWVALAGNAWPQ